LFLKNLLADLVKLKRPVTAASVVALVVELISPFGLNVGTAGPAITGALVAVGTIVAYLEHLGVKAS
jgi:hypothetical protein